MAGSSMSVIPAKVVVGGQRKLTLVMTLAFLTCLCNVLDRSVLNILAEPIKRDLGLSDTQLGLLTGFAFALFYSLAGLPIARYADRPRSDRPTAIAVCMALWSGMTMLSGLVTSFGQLLAVRTLVAVGESGSGPAVITLMNHYVPAERRSRAFGIYGLGSPLGILIGLMVGGWLVGLVGWRWAFLLVGAPGLLLAAVIRLMLPEPRRTAPNPTRNSQGDQPSLIDNFRVIYRSPALLALTIATSTGGMFVAGLPNWTGVYLIRVLQLSPAQAGMLLGLSMGTGAIGTFFGGAIADRLATRHAGRALLVPCLGLLLGLPAAILAFLTNDWRIFAALYWVSVVGAAAYFGPFFSVVQLLVGEKYRATTIVIILMLFNLVGVGFSSLGIGVASDVLRLRLGVDSLRWALVAGHLFAVVPAYFYFRAASLAGRQITTDGTSA